MCRILWSVWCEIWFTHIFRFFFVHKWMWTFKIRCWTISFCPSNPSSQLIFGLSWNSSNQTFVWKCKMEENKMPYIRQWGRQFYKPVSTMNDCVCALIFRMHPSAIKQIVIYLLGKLDLWLDYFCAKTEKIRYRFKRNKINSSKGAHIKNYTPNRQMPGIKIQSKFMFVF